VEWTFVTSPPNAQIFLGDKLLGVAPGPFSLTKKEESGTVVIKAQGYDDEEMFVPQSSNQRLTVRLKRRLAPANKPIVPKDLEYPF